jgi:peroxiredoxin
MDGGPHLIRACKRCLARAGGETGMKNKLRNVTMLAILMLAALVGSAHAQASSLRTTDGKAISLADLKGKLVVLSFGGTWVPLTSKELPALQKLADNYSARGVAFYWVSINSDKTGTRTFIADPDLEAFARKNNLRIPVLRDPEQKLYKELGLDGLPTIVIFDRQGKVIRKQVGFGTETGEAYGGIIRDLDQLLK